METLEEQITGAMANHRFDIALNLLKQVKDDEERYQICYSELGGMAVALAAEVAGTVKVTTNKEEFEKLKFSQYILYENEQQNIAGLGRFISDFISKDNPLRLFYEQKYGKDCWSKE